MKINALLEKKHPDITDLVYLLKSQGEEENMSNVTAVEQGIHGSLIKGG